MSFVGRRLDQADVKKNWPPVFFEIPHLKQSNISLLLFVLLKIFLSIEAQNTHTPLQIRWFFFWGTCGFGSDDPIITFQANHCFISSSLRGGSTRVKHGRGSDGDVGRCRPFMATRWPRSPPKWWWKVRESDTPKWPKVRWRIYTNVPQDVGIDGSGGWVFPWDDFTATFL